MNPESQIELPSGIRDQLHGFRRRLWWVETVVALLGGGCGLLGVYVLLFASDRCWETPAWARLALLVVGVTGWAVAAGFWFWRWGWRPRDTRALAVLVQRQYPRLGDRLLGVVELADDVRRPSNVSAALCRAAMDQVAREAATLDFTGAVRAGAARWWGLGAVVLAGLVAGVVLVLPGAAGNALARLARPWGAVGRYTLVRLRALPATRVVAHGEPFTVEARLDPGSRWSPGVAHGRLGAQSPVAVPLAGDGYRFELPGQTEAGTLRISAGDARERTLVQPLIRPDLVALTARIEWPAYLGYDPVTRDVAGGTLPVLAGSRVSVEGRVSRDLAAATVSDVALTVTGPRFEVPPRLVEASGEWVLGWQDRFGLSVRDPFVLKVILQEDAPPAVVCRGSGRVVAILEDELFSCEAVAEDDYGVRQVDLAWEALGNDQAGVKPTRGRLELASGDRQQKIVRAPVSFAPRALGIGPQRVVLRAQATDYFPGRLPSASPPIELLVLDRLEHARLVQRELERLQEKFEEILRAEESLFESNRDLTNRLGDAAAPDRLREQQRGEEANREQLARVLDEAADLLREALRNKLISATTLQQWAEVLQKLEPVSRQAMPAVAKSLAAAQQQSTVGARGESMARALAQQQEVLQEMLEALQKMNKTGDQLMAENFINRLRQAAESQTGVAGDLVKLVPETIGLHPDSLSSLARARLEFVGTRATRNQKSVKSIRDDLGHFYERVKIEQLQTVHRSMEESRIVEELSALAEQIKENLTGQSVDAARDWSKKLGAWADMLAKAQGTGDGGGGGGGGGGQASAKVLEQLMRLLRVRQAEEGLRQQTRFLDENKPADPAYEESAARLEKVQESLVDVVNEVGDAVPDPELLKLLGRVETAMRDAAELLAKPQTDGATIGAETEVIELLSESAQQVASSSSSSAGGAMDQSSVLAMLSQMLGMGSGTTGTGSERGGATDRASEPVTGQATGPGAGERSVEKAVGRDRGTWPVEFRDALDAYIGAVEEMNR